MRLCKGGCGTRIGSGCGCCGDDFPEMHGYCSKCFPSSPAYLELTQNIKAVLDRLDIGGCLAMVSLLENWDCDMEVVYLDLVKQKILELRG